MIRVGNVTWVSGKNPACKQYFYARKALKSGISPGNRWEDDQQG